MKRLLTIPLLFVVTFVHAQQAEEEDYSYEYLSPLNDPSAEGQMYFVEELMDLAGYAPEKIVTSEKERHKLLSAELSSKKEMLNKLI